MKATITLASLAYKEYLRRKIFVLTLLMMFIVAGTGLLSNPFTVGTHARLMRDLALLFIQLFLIFFGSALGSTALGNEIERKTLYTFLAKPISRAQYLWGKFLAIGLLILLNSLILGIELILVLKISTGELSGMVLAACLLTALEAMVVTSFCIFFSTFMTVAVTFASVILLYVTGSLSHVYITTLTADNHVMQWGLVHLKSMIPYFDYFSIRSAVVHNHPVSLLYLSMAIVYGALYIVAVMLLADAVFSRKDL